MSKHWSLYDLDIIGFASTLETPVLPRILAPVFQTRENDTMVLMPPFSIVGDEVFKAAPVTLNEFDDLVRRGQVTRLEKPIPGGVGHDLWVSEKGIVAYELKSKVKEAFASIFEQHLLDAERALTSGDYDAAAEHAGVARAVNPTHIDPLVIRATAERLGDQLSRFTFTRHLAADYLSPGEFDRLVDARMGDNGEFQPHRAACMFGAATRKSRLCAV